MVSWVQLDLQELEETTVRMAWDSLDHKAKRGHEERVTLDPQERLEPQGFEVNQVPLGKLAQTGSMVR